MRILRRVVLLGSVAILLGSMMVGSTVPVAAQGGIAPDKRHVIPVVDVAIAAREPFAFWEKLEVGEAGYAATKPFMVPMGKQLVVEFISSVDCAPEGEKLSLNMLVSYDIRGQQGVQKLKVLVEEQGVFFDMEVGARMMHFGTSQMMKAYVQGGQTFSFEAWRSGREGPAAEVAIWMVGYLVPAV